MPMPRSYEHVYIPDLRCPDYKAVGEHFAEGGLMERASMHRLVAEARKVIEDQ